MDSRMQIGLGNGLVAADSNQALHRSTADIKMAIRTACRMRQRVFKLPAEKMQFMVELADSPSNEKCRILSSSRQISIPVRWRRRPAHVADKNGRLCRRRQLIRAARSPKINIHTTETTLIPLPNPNRTNRIKSLWTKNTTVANLLAGPKSARINPRVEVDLFDLPTRGTSPVTSRGSTQRPARAVDFPIRSAP